MTDTTYKGGLASISLESSLDVGALVVTVTGDFSGWMTGADGRAFVVTVDPDTAKEERLLCESLSGSGSVRTLALVERGYDGTSETGHDANAVVTHELDGKVVDDLVLHVVDVARDDHSQYLTVQRHNDPSVHEFGVNGALGVPGTPAAVGTTADAGIGPVAATENHVHVLGDGSINTSTLFAAGVVDANALEADAVTTAAIAANAVGSSELADDSVDARVLAPNAVTTTELADKSVDPAALVDGFQAVVVANHDAATPAQEDGALWYQPDKHRYYSWINGAWRWVMGRKARVAMSYHGAGANIPNDAAAHALTGFTGDILDLSDAGGELGGGGTFTVPAVQANGIAFDGEYEFDFDLLVGNEGTAAGTAFELFLIAGGITYNVDIKANAPNHSTTLRGRKTVSLIAGNTAHFELAIDGANATPVADKSTVRISYVGPT